jgi:type IV pilus assembly protein PilY1
MATPVLVDTDGDRIVDHTYVGDLRGNLWKIDLGAKNPGDWDFAFKDTSTGKPLPLFTATIDGTTPQPITTRPEVARGPYGAGVMVLFGTGKYLETGDNQPSASEPQQSFYGLIDANTHTASDRIAGRNKLVAQTISTVSFDPDGATGPALGFPVRTITDNTIAANKTGWYMDLPTNGERQITNPVVRSDRVIFTTLIPTAEACSYGGTSWLMEVDLLNGGSLPSAPLDTNGDNVVDEHDLLDGGGVPIGLMEQQYLSAPAIVEPPGDGLARKIMSGSGGDLVGKGEAAAHGSRGRQSWRQIR